MVFAGIFFAIVTSACRVQKTTSELPANPALEGVHRAADGGIVALRPPTDGLTVLVFYSSECPISNFYIPVLNDLVSRYGTERIRWVGACVDPDISPEDQRKHAREYSVGFPVIADPRGELASAVGAKFTPEVAVFNGKGELIYRGRIDDHYAKRGVKSASAERHDLDDAVKAGLAGKMPEHRETQAVGCPLPEVAPAEETKITYTQHIAPLIFRRCLECHREGSIAPFSLETYQQARRRAYDLADVTASRFMPPSRIDPRFGQTVQHDLALSDDEIALFAQWTEQGAVEGDPGLLPQKPEFPEGWTLGQPDLVLEMPETFEVPATGPDIYRYFVLPTGLTEDKFIQAVEFDGVNLSPAVHHIMNYLDASGEAAKLDLQDPRPGYDSFGGPGVPVVGELSGWAPGVPPDLLPEGIARKLPAKSDVAMEIHYHPTGKVERSRIRLGLHFSKQPVKQRWHWIVADDLGFKIPAGAKNHRIEFETKPIPTDLDLHMVFPHMHLLGKDMTIWMEKPDGTHVDLLRAAPWEFAWQKPYYLEKPLRMPKGSTIHVRAHYDNSSSNPRNPLRSNPVDVVYGQQATDEMCLAAFGFVKPDQDLTQQNAKDDLAELLGDWEKSIISGETWRVWSPHEVGPVVFIPTETGFRVEVPKSAVQADRWHVQVKHLSSFKSGQKYEIAVKLRADAPRAIALGVLQNHRPYDNLCQSQTLQLSDEWQTFRKSFTAERDEPDAQIVLAAGGSDIPFDIGEVTISTSPPDEDKTKFTVR